MSFSMLLYQVHSATTRQTDRTVKTKYLSIMVGWGCSSAGTASDRHTAEAGSIPRCGKGFFSQGQLSVQTL